MMNLSKNDFEVVTEEDIALIEKYLALAEYEESNHNIVNLMLWLNSYPLWKQVNQNWLLLLGMHEGELFVYMPLCEKKYLVEALEKAKEVFDYYNLEFVLSSYTKEVMDIVAPYFKEYYPLSYRDPADYVYSLDTFRAFKGKKLQKKRNHLNFFYKNYGDRFSYETITIKNISECLDFLKKWRVINDELLEEEVKGVEYIFSIYDSLPIVGGLIRVDGEVKGFILGSSLSSRMCQINVQKGDLEIRGLYQVLFKEFLSREFLNASYVNLEDDMGKENIRKAKLSYYPEYLIYKYKLCKR